MKDQKCKYNNQVIIHTEINNYKPLKEYIINLNGNGNNYHQNPSLDNIFSQKIFCNSNNYINIEKNLNKSFIKYNNNPYSKLTHEIIPKNIKPYKKKPILYNKNKIKEQNENIKLNLISQDTINNNWPRERSFNRTKKNFYKKEENNILNINYKLNKSFYDKNEKLASKPINTIFYRNKNFHTINNNYTLNIYKSQNRKIPLTKKYINNIKINGINKHPKKELFKIYFIQDEYHKRFIKILIILLEKYFKTYLLRRKYIFINNLKKYKKIIIKSLKIKNNQNRFLNNTICLTERTNENHPDIPFKTKFRSRNENLLINKLKTNNIRYSPDNFGLRELYRNKNELKNKEEKINRRKESKSRSRKNSKESKPTLKYFNNSKSIDNIMKLKKNNCFYNKIKPMLIIKTIKTVDKRINIDIKYLEQFYSSKKRPFKNLKISKTLFINFIQKSNHNINLKKKYYKIEKNNGLKSRRKKILSKIQEEE